MIKFVLDLLFLLQKKQKMLFSVRICDLKIGNSKPKSNLSILVIDDDKFHLDILVSKLKSLKYSNLRLANTYNEAITSLMESLPDIIITDYYLDHNKTALDIFKNVNVSFPTPIIIISSFLN